MILMMAKMMLRTVDDELSEHIIVKTIKEAVHKVVNMSTTKCELGGHLEHEQLAGSQLEVQAQT
jgi:hypothetical protein